MTQVIKYFSEIISIGGWFMLWGLGGIWLVRTCFRLRENEQVITGLGVGLVLQTVVANQAARLFSAPQSFWIGAGIIFLAGFIGALAADGWRSLYRIPLRPVQLVTLLLLFYVFYSVSRGLAILDDYAHLPTVSMMAVGDIPPHFALDPQIPYSYHYLLLLFSAEVMRLACTYAWIALDFARALTFAIAVILAGVWTQRLTRSKTAGILGGLMLAFGMGTRWLLLLLPPSMVAAMSSQVHMLGSALQSGPQLATALIKDWTIEGGGPLPYPFAFVNGMVSPGVMAHGSIGMVGSLITLPIILTFNHWRGWWAGIVSAVLLSALALVSETGTVMAAVGWGAITLLYMIKNRTWRLPSSLWLWLVVIAASQILGFLQGGALTDILSGYIDTAATGAAQVSYQTVGFRIVFPPELVSAHLGVLSFGKPLQLLLALLEMGPGLLVIPLAAVYAWKAYKVGRYNEAVAIFTSILTIGAVFIEFTGSTGIRNTARLYKFVSLGYFWSVPLVWNWVVHRSFSLKVAAAVLTCVTMFGGVVLFGTELVAAQKPVQSSWANLLDQRAAHDYWNKLEPGALVFDPRTSRAPTLFGRATNSSTTWYSEKPDWLKLVKNPDPVKLRAYGFQYAYVDNKYWDALPPETARRMQTGCVKEMKEWSGDEGTWRMLLDLRSCQ